MGKRRATHRGVRRGAHRSEPEGVGALRRFGGFLGSTVPRRVEPPRLLNVLVVSGLLLGVLLFGYSTTQIYLQFGGESEGSEAPGAAEGLDPEPSSGQDPDGHGSAGDDSAGNDSAEHNGSASETPQGRPGDEPTTVAYRVVERDGSDFTGRITLTNTSESHLDTWELALAFDDAEVTDVHGDAEWEPLEDGVLIHQADGDGGDGLAPGESVTLPFDATGDPDSSPVRCSLNGHVCTL